MIAWIQSLWNRYGARKYQMIVRTNEDMWPTLETIRVQMGLKTHGDVMAEALNLLAVHSEVQANGGKLIEMQSDMGLRNLPEWRRFR